MRLKIAFALVVVSISAMAFENHQERFKEMMIESQLYEDLERIKGSLSIDRQQSIHAGNLSVKEIELLIQIAEEYEESNFTEKLLTKDEYLNELIEVKKQLTKN